MPHWLRPKDRADASEGLIRSTQQNLGYLTFLTNPLKKRIDSENDPHEDTLWLNEEDIAARRMDFIPLHLSRKKTDRCASALYLVYLVSFFGLLMLDFVFQGSSRSNTSLSNDTDRSQPTTLSFLWAIIDSWFSIAGGVFTSFLMAQIYLWGLHQPAHCGGGKCWALGSFLLMELSLGYLTYSFYAAAYSIHPMLRLSFQLSSVVAGVMAISFLAFGFGIRKRLWRSWSFLPLVIEYLTQPQTQPTTSLCSQERYRASKSRLCLSLLQCISLLLVYTVGLFFLFHILSNSSHVIVQCGWTLYLGTGVLSMQSVILTLGQSIYAVFSSVLYFHEVMDIDLEMARDTSSNSMCDSNNTKKPSATHPNLLTFATRTIFDYHLGTMILNAGVVSFCTWITSMMTSISCCVRIFLNQKKKQPLGEDKVKTETENARCCLFCRDWSPSIYARSSIVMTAIAGTNFCVSAKVRMCNFKT